MYVWYYAGKINATFTNFIQLGKYTGQLKELSEDDSVPKFSTHLIYLTKARSRDEIEDKSLTRFSPKNPKEQTYIDLYI